jgi:pyruvate-formate lyase
VINALAAVEAGGDSARAPKWGNDDDRADAWGVRLQEARQRAVRRTCEATDTPWIFTCHVVRSLHHLDGKHTPATPDGREAGEPLADSLGAQCGTNTVGPTGILNSVLKIPAATFDGVYNLNLTLMQTPHDILAALVGAFFEAGGQELQVNVLDASKLRDARKHPERFRDLVVRVAGLSARFIELSNLEQAELIRRAEAAC